MLVQRPRTLIELTQYGRAATDIYELDWIGSGKWTHVQVWYSFAFRLVLVGLVTRNYLLESQSASQQSQILSFRLQILVRICGS